MIATVTLNPSLDRTITVDGLVVDETNRWTGTKLYAGGKGIDVSRAIHEMDGITTAYGFVGGADGEILKILLSMEGVPFNFTAIEQETRTNFIITDTTTSHQTKINAPGPQISKEELERLIAQWRGINPSPDLMVFGGSVPPGVPVNIYHDLVTGAKGYGVRSILDSEGKWLEDGTKAKPYLVKPTVHEAQELLKTELPTEEAIINGALDLVETGIEVAVISRGKEGIITATRERIIKAVPPPVKVSSAVGAGDCTIAGLAIKLAYGEPLVEACRLAVAMGSAAVLTPGTELCHKADVEKLLPQIQVWEMATAHRAKAFFHG